MDLGCNAHRVVRIQRDVGIDGMDHYFVVFQVVGGSTIIQNDRAVQLAVGDAALVRLISAKGAREFVKLQPNWLRHAPRIRQASAKLAAPCALFFAQLELRTRRHGNTTSLLLAKR